MILRGIDLSILFINIINEGRWLNIVQHPKKLNVLHNNSIFCVLIWALAINNIFIVGKVNYNTHY